MRDTFYRELLDNLYDGVYFVDRERRITYWNRGAERLTGYRREDALGRSCFDDFLSHVDEKGRRLCQDGCPLMETIEDGQQREAEIFLHHKNGHRLPVSVRVSPISAEDGTLIGAVEVFSDNSAKVDSQRRIQELEQLALLDDLTKLGNRRYLEMSLKGRMAEMKRYNNQVGVFFMDIDHFKDINDLHGHNCGDEVLRVLSRSLTGVIRPSDILGRWGGEEFLAVANTVTRGTIKPIAERFRQMIESSSVPFEGQIVRFTISVGATIAKVDDTLESVIERADQLMYRSKERGRNQVTVG